MKQEETPETTRPKINSERLNELIKSPTIGLLQEKGKTICFEGYDIEDEYIILNHTLEININLTFENCSFKGNNALGIDGLICHGEVKFENCNFESGVYLIDGTFKKELSFKCIESDKIWLLGGNYETIHISGYTIDEIDIMGGQFQLLEIGGFPIDRDIKKLSIRDRGHKLGNINVSQQNYTKISIGGLNDGNTYDFKDVKSNTVSISNFINEGYLNFYGMEPKDPDDELRYFQITNSNLGNTLFSRTQFSKYKEFIIIDSFITDSLFISCDWSENIRAIRGPGFGNFEESLQAGRKITKDEIPYIREAYRQLKIAMSKRSDKIQENKFYAQELNYYNKSLAWACPWYNQFWDKLILCFSNRFSNYGQSFIRPLFWLLLVHFILFTFAVWMNILDPLHITWKNPTKEGIKVAFEKYFIYINPVRSPTTSFSGYFIFLDIVMRVWSSYMIYNIIRASRRFIT